MGKEGGCLPPLDLFLWCYRGLELKVLPGPLGESALGVGWGLTVPGTWNLRSKSQQSPLYDVSPGRLLGLSVDLRTLQNPSFTPFCPFLSFLRGHSLS